MSKVIVIAVTAIGGLFLFAAVCETIELLASKQWLEVEGVIEDTKLFESYTSGDSDSQGYTSYWVNIEYQFQVDTETFRDEEAVDLDSGTVPPKYQSGSKLRLFHHPSDPNRSYLIHPGFESPIVCSVIGSVLLLISSPFLLYHGSLFYANFHMRKANRLMQQGLDGVQDIRKDADEILAAGGELPDDWKKREADLLEKANEANELMREIESQRDSLQ